MTTTSSSDDYTRAALKAHREWLTGLNRPRPGRTHRHRHLFRRRR